MTAADGSFAVREVPSGDARLSLFESEGPNAGAPQRIPIRVPEAPELVCDVDLALPVGGEISGTVVRASDGSPVHGARVLTFEIRGGLKRVVRQAETDTEGAYRIVGLEPGDYVVTVNPPAPHPGQAPLGELLATECRAPVAVAVGRATSVGFSLRAGGTAAVVLRDSSGRPFPNGFVSLHLAGEEAAFDEPGMYLPSSPDRGECLFGGVPPGVYYALFRPFGTLESGWSEDHSVVAGARTEFQIHLEPGAPVEVRLEGEDGPGITQAVVRFVYDERRFVSALQSWDSFTLDRSNSTRRAVLPPGAWTLLVSAPGCREESRPVRIEQGSPQTIVVRLERKESPR